MAIVGYWLMNLHGHRMFWVGACEQGENYLINWLTRNAGNGQGEMVHIIFWDSDQPNYAHGDCVFLAPTCALAMGDCGTATGMYPLCKI